MLTTVCRITNSPTDIVAAVTTSFAPDAELAAGCHWASMLAVMRASTSRTSVSTVRASTVLASELAMTYLAIILDSHHAPADRRRVVLQQCPGAFAIAGQHHPLAPSGPQRVDRQHRLAVGRAAIDAKELHDQELGPLHRAMFDRRGRGSDNQSNLHGGSNLFVVWKRLLRLAQNPQVVDQRAAAFAG